MVHYARRGLRLSVAMLVLLASAAVLGMPLHVPSVAHAAGFIDFENGSDRAPIRSTIPGLQFTTTDGQDWIYGDWRTQGYNGPYPTGAYYSNGNFFAWLGENQGDGRIDFTQGDATFLSVQVSTANVVRMRGYDAGGAVIAESEFSGGNLNTGRLNTLSVEAPSGQEFRYVIISGDANYWLIDDLSTDAEGVPGNGGTGGPDDPDDPANIVVVQRPNPNTVASRSSVDYGLSADAPPSVANDGIVDYVVTVTNYGAGTARNAIILMPYASDALRVLDATFSDDGAYVSRLITDTTTAVEFHSGALGPSETLTATLRLLVRPGAPDGASLGQRLTYSWTDDRSGGTGASNLPFLVAGSADNNQPYYPVTITPTSAAPGVARTVGSAVFVPFEPVGLWYNAPNGTTVGIGSAQADANGSVAGVFDTSGVPAGNYTLVVAGQWSQFNAVAPFTVQP